jgi:CRISPR-associated protein Csb2
MFALGIRYLLGRTVATHPADREQAEWPPHPERVFMALVAAHYQAGGAADERKALLWLEQQAAPALTVSDCEVRSSVTVYVPVNDLTSPRLNTNATPSSSQIADGLALLPENRYRQPRRFMAAVPRDPVVFLHWSATLDEPTLHALQGLCRKVTAIGHSSSLVQMWLELSPPEANLIASANPAARYRLRVAGAGHLVDLDARYNREEWDQYRQLNLAIAAARGKRQKELKTELAQRFGHSRPSFRRPVPSLWQGYDPVTPAIKQSSAPGTSFGSQLIILRRVDGPSFCLESTLQLTKALRDTLMAKCPVQPVPEWISGHAGDGTASATDHVAFVPLPHVGREHADGHLLGLGLAVPKAISPEEQSRCWRSLLFDKFGFASEPLDLRLGPLGVWQVQLEQSEGHAVALRSETWTAADATGARRWATVTPISFDQHPSGPDKWQQIEQMIARACQRIGLPPPTDIVMSPVSMFIGSPHGRGFPCLRRKSGGNIHHTHAILTFERPVIGPILVGAGRYRGYGFCRPLREEEALP